LFRTGLQPVGREWNLPQPWTAKDLQDRVVRLRLLDDLKNLHDVFLNASIAKRVMERTDIDPRFTDDATLIADRFRLERIWVMLLAVLSEAWQSQRFGDLRSWLASLTDVATLGRMIQEDNRRPAHQRIVEVRNYMAHRDQRSFWDAGRMGPVGQYDWNSKLHAEFSRVLLVGLRNLRSLAPWLSTSS